MASSYGNPATPNGDAPTALTLDDNATNRRKSGRVSRKPNIYMPEAVHAPHSGQAKRKRVDQNGGVADQDDASGDSQDESDNDDNDDDAHEEETREKKRKAVSGRKSQNKPAAKKPKTGIATAGKTLAVRTAAARPLQKPRKPRTKHGGANVGTGSLYDKLFLGDEPLDAAAAGWVSSYEENNIEGMRDLINMVLEATGCDLKINEHDIEDQDNVTGRLSDLQDEYQAQKITDYPLISRTRSSPPFRSTLMGFFHSLVATIHASSLLYSEPALIENIQVWVTTMSSSAIRPFRHTATVISLAIVSTLCEIALEIAESNAKTLRLLEAEKKKKAVNKARVGALQGKIDEGSQKRETTEGTIKDIFDTVFVHRYRDVDPRIRADCVQALGHWIVTLPDVFFEGKYLRYLGWVLSDVSAPTRQEVVKQLQRLFKSKDSVGGLRTFTERFRPRLVEMAVRDADSGVRASTVELLDSIRAAELLEPDDIDTVGRLMFDSDGKVRKAVVGFVAENINDLYEAKIDDLGMGDEDKIEGALAREGDDDFDSPRLAWLRIKSLVEVLQTYDAEDRDELPSQIMRGPTGGADVLVAAGVDSRFSLAAQALCESFPELKEWEVLAGYLLYDHSAMPSKPSKPSKKHKPTAESALKEASRLAEKEEIILLDLLLAAVKLSLSSSEDTDASRRSKKKKASKTESLEMHETTARHLAQLIPRLLKKFGATPATASAVLRLEHVLNLDVFQELRQDSTTYSSLLDDINKQFLTHADQSVLVEASAALLHAKGFEELEEVTDEKVQHLWDDTVNTYQTLVKGKDIGHRGNMSSNVLTAILNTVRRISNLASISDCSEMLERMIPTAGRRKSQQQQQASVNVVRSLIEILGRAKMMANEQLAEEINDQEDELINCAIKSVLFYFMWKARTFKDMISKDVDASNVDVDYFKECRDAFAKNLIMMAKTRGGVDDVRLTAAGVFIDLHTLFSTLRQAKASKGSKSGLEPDAYNHLLAFSKEISAEDQSTLLSVFVSAEKVFAKKSGRSLEAGETDAPMDDESEEEDEADEDDEALREKHAQALVHEQQLCELVGKMVLAIIARVLDASGPLKGTFKDRLNRNRARLGQNFKEVVAYLDEPKARRGKKQVEKKDSVKTSERIVEDEDDEAEGQAEVEEGGEEDLRNKELALDDNEAESDDAEDADPIVDDVEDEIMGD